SGTSQTYRAVSYSLSGANACTSVSLSPNPASPQASGTTVARSASASCGRQPGYIFYLFDGACSVAQSWSTNATFNWSTTGLAAGRYYFPTRRSSDLSGTSQTYRAVSYSLSGANACTSVSLSPNPASPQASGTTVA